MNINHIREKIKEILSKTEKRDIYTPLIIILVAVSSFFLGKISLAEAGKPPVLVETVNMPKCPVEPAASPKPASKVAPKPKKTTTKKKTATPAILKP